jgi:hypothetical protein
VIGDSVNGNDEIADIILARCGSTKRQAPCRAIEGPRQWTSTGRATIIDSDNSLATIDLNILRPLSAHLYHALDNGLHLSRVIE